ncbi:hypothetical protein HAX54_050796 [Datura stramonium]|uniref:Uncharacterized protein n=1 Tax=Datura stramonium TaxID=4076 RepID=A0ABS8WQM6_DATST|nr:hypothetical protein [Datura stramonium]
MPSCIVTIEGRQEDEQDSPAFVSCLRSPREQPSSNLSLSSLSLDHKLSNCILIEMNLDTFRDLQIGRLILSLSRSNVVSHPVSCLWSLMSLTAKALVSVVLTLKPSRTELQLVVTS